jgi:hypothetical protein
MHLTGLVATGLALAAPSGSEAGKAGPLGLLVILLLGLATFFLVRSMNRHLRKVPPSFDHPTEPDKQRDPGEPPPPPPSRRS